MPEEKRSQYDLFRGKLSFTDEPLWFRVTLCALILLGALGLALILAKVALPALGVRWLSRLPWVNRLLKGSDRSS